MQQLRFWFSPSGRLRPLPFVLAALLVYAAGAASHLLTAPDAVARGGLWLFAAAQALLTWIWFSLHAKRLSDADRGAGLAAAVAALYALSVVLFLIVATSFFSSLGAASDKNAMTGAGLVLLVWIIASLSAWSDHDVGWLIVAALMVIAVLPMVLAACLTAFAATRPSAAPRAA